MRAAIACWTALLPALAGGQVDDPAFRAKVDAALAAARPVLLEHLRLQHGGVLALMCLAASHDGVPRDDKSFARALDRLSRARLNGTYDLALRLMVMAEVADFPRRDKRIAQDTKRLLQRQMLGGFTYPQRYETWDLSNTQYAALGLRAAAALGQSIEPKVWSEVARVVMDLQAEDGGFAYTKKHRRHRPYPSMTVAGIAVLQICKQQLGAAAPAAIDDHLARAWRWMKLDRFKIGDISTLSCFYFHYGLERAAILSDVTHVGELDWYRTGAEMLLREQMDSGAWRSFKEIRPGALPGEGSAVDTGFAILFLRRKFQKVLEAAVSGPRGLGGLSSNASDLEVERAVEAMVKRGNAAIPELLKAMRSVVTPRRRAAARALLELTGKDFGYLPEKHPDDLADAIKAAEHWWLTEGRNGMR